MRMLFRACICHSPITFNKLILSHRLWPAASILLIFVIPVLSIGVHWDQCMINLRNATWSDARGISSGGTDHHGHPTPITNVTTAITYDLCKTACGSGFFLAASWSTFLEQFGSWLLPWLALVSQLPFGANDSYDNLIATLLTLGSPTLAAYSLALTVLNGRWVAKQFMPWNYHNSRNAARILNSLQQAPLKVTTDAALLASLVVLSENDEWWAELVVWLDVTHTWSVPAATSIAWVIIAYILAVIDAIFGPGAYTNTRGQGIGALWLWLLPIVAGWFQISPECDSERLQNAINRANRIAYVATSGDGPELASSKSRRNAVSLRSDHRDVLRRDEGCTVPIYNYARFLPWVQAVETVAGVFHAASERADQHIPVDPKVEWVNSSNSHSLSHRRNRKGTQEQVVKYCVPDGEYQGARGTMWGSDVWSRIFTASVIALSLQWGTTGAGILVEYFTPTTG